MHVDVSKRSIFSRLAVRSVLAVSAADSMSATGRAERHEQQTGTSNVYNL